MNPTRQMTSLTLLDQCGDTQRRLLETLLHAPQGTSVDQLVEELDISTNAVRQHLASLERDGLIERAGTQRTGGRPQLLFVLSGAGHEAFPRRYRQLAEDLIEEVGSVIGSQALESSMRRMGTRAGGQVKAGNLATIEETAVAMKQAGYEASATSDKRSGPEIVAHNCVFHSLAARFPAVCQFDLAFMEAATGRKVEHRECMVRGGQVCRFGFGAKVKSR